MNCKNCGAPVNGFKCDYCLSAVENIAFHTVKPKRVYELPEIFGRQAVNAIALTVFQEDPRKYQELKMQAKVMGLI